MRNIAKVKISDKKLLKKRLIHAVIILNLFFTIIKFFKDEYLEFAIFRKGLETKISGKEIFNSLIEYLKIKKLNFKGIKGLWSSSSDNTIAFNKAVLENNLSNQKAAFETWTGQRALAQGFDKVIIEKLVPEKPPHTSITVIFFK